MPYGVPQHTSDYLRNRLVFGEQLPAASVPDASP